MLEKTINEDIVSAMKEKNKQLTTVLRMTKASIQNEAIIVKRELTDDEVLSIILKQVKTLNESITEFAKGGRDDLISKAKEEIAILEKYLPEQLTEEEVKEILDKVIEEIKPSGMKDMGQVMKEITAKVKGKADMSKISQLVKDKLM